MIMEAFCIKEDVVTLYFQLAAILLPKQTIAPSKIPRDPFVAAQRPLQQPRPSASTSTPPYRWRERESATVSPSSKQLDFESKRVKLFDCVQVILLYYTQTPVTNQLVVASQSLTVRMRQQMPLVSSDTAGNNLCYITALVATCLFVVASPIEPIPMSTLREVASPKS
jgi:hypothetical protein